MENVFEILHLSAPEQQETTAPEDNVTTAATDAATDATDSATDGATEGQTPTEQPQEAPTGSSPLPTFDFSIPGTTEAAAENQTTGAAGTTVPTDSETGPAIPWGWITATILLSAAVIGLIVALVLRSCRNKAGSGRSSRRPGPISRTEQNGSGRGPEVLSGDQAPLPAGCPQVGKLHQQGARSSQQDCFSVTPKEVFPSCGMLAVVADGMGGLSDGDKVSQAAVTAMINGFLDTSALPPQEQLLALLAQATQAVNTLLTPSEYNKSGTTLLAGLVRDRTFYCLSVGDSHIYLYRDGALLQLNREHVYRHDLQVRSVNQGTDPHAAWTHPKAGGLTSFLGMGPLKYVDMPDQGIPIRDGDRFLLMSDGVYNALPIEELTGCVTGTAGQIAEKLDQAIQSKHYSNQDNYTAVILAF